MLTSEFDYDLPPELIAQRPAERRDQSRLLHLDRTAGSWAHRRFADFPGLLRPGDLLVFNESRGIPARLGAFRTDAPGDIEVLLLEETGPRTWLTMARPARRLRPGDELGFWNRDGSRSRWTARVAGRDEEGRRLLDFSGDGDWPGFLAAAGSLPLPPYVERPSGVLPEDLERYQTVYARVDGSIAAPTAGLHFTPEILDEVRRRGALTANVVLHVGAGTFVPVKAEAVEDHVMHEERYEIPAETASAAAAVRAAGGRIVAVGTTSLRALESAARSGGGRIAPGPARTRLFVRPGDAFAVVDALLTNFHLPRSTLLMLVGAFAAPGAHPRGMELIRRAYASAVAERYRFFSYGDAMFID